MTRERTSSDKSEREAEKARRLGVALRANLFRRKERAKARAGGDAPPASDGAGHDPERKVEDE